MSESALASAFEREARNQDESNSPRAISELLIELMVANVMEAESPTMRLTLCRIAADSLSRGAPLPAAIRNFLVKILQRIGAGEDPIRVLNLRKKPGKPRTFSHELATGRTLIEMIERGVSQNCAVEKYLQLPLRDGKDAPDSSSIHKAIKETKPELLERWQAYWKIHRARNPGVPRDVLILQLWNEFKKSYECDPTCNSTDK